MITPEFAQHFAREWIAAWNAHDLPRVLAHYRDDFTMASPYIAAITGEPSGVLTGKAAVAAYWQRALAAYPQLHFTLTQVLAGAGSVVICYEGVRGPAAEVFFFDDDGLVVRAAAHYA